MPWLCGDRVTRKKVRPDLAGIKSSRDAKLCVKLTARRDPDVSYLEWIRIMNTNGGDYRAMISGFMNSNEYVQRFGP